MARRVVGADWIETKVRNSDDSQHQRDERQDHPQPEVSHLRTSMAASRPDRSPEQAVLGRTLEARGDGTSIRSDTAS
jgi:hypothetical protein